MNSILIIDDERDNLEALRRLLRNDFEVETTTSPFEALKLIQRKPYSVIVSDQRMPEMSGVELLEKIKNLSPNTVRVLLTGYTDIDSIVGAINRGQIYRYITKPWDNEDFRITMRQANEAYNLRQELEAKNKELGQALEALQTLDKAKANFISLVSHELNTPLTVLTAYLPILDENRKSLGDDAKKAVDAIKRSSDRFSEIIGDTLAYLRLDLEQKLNFAPFAARTELEQLLKENAAALKEKKITVAVEGSSDLSFRADPEKLKTALRRLISESIKHAPTSSEIKFRISEEPNEIQFSITRQGESFSADALTAFTNPGNILNHHQGLGLGLAMCRLIAESHGGKIEIAPPAKGTTTIHLRLPASDE